MALHPACRRRSWPTRAIVTGRVLGALLTTPGVEFDGRRTRPEPPPVTIGR